MQNVRISQKKALDLLKILKKTKLGKQAFLNILQVSSLIKYSGENLIAVEFDKKEEIVKEGMIKDPFLKDARLKYADVPLGLITKGEVVVLEDGKGVKQLLPGDFIGLFETAYYLISGRRKKIGKWTLVAESPVKIVFLGGFKSFDEEEEKVRKEFYSFLINTARSDIVPKPITDLPLLDWFSDETGSRLLDGTLILAHTHILPSNFGFLRHLAQLVSYNNLFIVEKPYSTIRPVFNKLVRMGAEVIPVITVRHAPYEFALKRSLDALWDKVLSVCKQKEISRIVIIDDGGDLLLSVPWEKLKKIKIVGVEQTQRGINRIINSRQKIPPVVNVASSVVKKNIESIFIAEAVVNKLKSINLLRPSVRFGIIGHGSIGKAIKKELQNKNSEVLNYDTLQHKKKLKLKKEMGSIDAIINRCDIVIGCSGTDFMKGVDLERISGKKTFISSSSADIEFFSLLNIAGFSDNSFKNVKLKPHTRLKIEILNGGYPINFDRKREWEKSEDMQITRCLMYAGIAQALRAQKKKGLVKLNYSYQEKIINKWAELKGNQKVTGITFAREG